MIGIILEGWGLQVMTQWFDPARVSLLKIYQGGAAVDGHDAVSYTHLTLPTILLV